ncbi:hypothetical protein X777_12688 [Ooceraea biroi]|uniref:Uncharacterized protein n=1 Tax=Ooceraea biroi TaxID=2015173 RepID=A0A026VYC9_OOCBI|nr:hypothetical protein X777_12688 [Ooceraea biroi]
MLLRNWNRWRDERSQLTHSICYRCSSSCRDRSHKSVFVMVEGDIWADTEVVVALPHNSRVHRGPADARVK